MSTRSDYTNEEWDAIRRAPAEAVLAVEQSSSVGFLGRRKEHKAEERSFKDVVAQFGGIALIDALLAAREEEGRPIDALREGGVGALDTAVETAGTARRAIQAKGTREELEAYAGAILETAEAVARAATGKGDHSSVNDAERLILRRLADALGRPDYEPPTDHAFGLGSYE